MKAAEPPAAVDPTAALNREFTQALRALRETGQADLACRLAARAWRALRHSHPDEARRLERLLHHLVNPLPSQPALPSQHKEP